MQPRPKLGAWLEELNRLLEVNAARASRERQSLIQIYEELSGLGYEGGYDAVRRYASNWARNQSSGASSAFVPLNFAPGEACQFDWSHEVVAIDGATTTIKVAHVRLCHSRMFFVRAYPRETQEMVFDAHDRAFAFFKGTCTRGIYDNMKTAVETIFTGKERLYNRRFLQMASHSLVEPVACTPAAGWEKGQVESRVGTVRQRFFTPRVRVKSYEELNAWLVDKCIASARSSKHPELTDKTVWEVFQEERPHLVPYAGRSDGFHSLPAAVSKTCLVRFDNNRYSVAAHPIRAVRRPVAVPSDQQALRADFRHRHHQPGIRRVADRLWGREDDHRIARSPHPSLRHRRDRQRRLAYQNPSLNPLQNAGPRRLRQLESYAATGLLNRSPEGALLGADRGASFNAD